LKDGQASRFATILFYLNEGMEGGETSFPRWLNGETNQVLKVKPEVGKAILFYNQLPDGNYDERSQHAALPVVEGEKWLTNMWVWVSGKHSAACV
jgi:prolyl 4-hydroxylase